MTRNGHLITRKDILLITFVGISPLVLGLGLCLIHWVEGYFDFCPVDADCRPFIASRYYPNDIRVNKQYQKLHIKEMSYEWEGKGNGNTGIFLKDKSWDSLYTKNQKRSYNFYDSLTGEYTYHLFGIDQLIEENVNIAKFFKGKKRGDEFKYTVTVVYSLDNELENTQIIEQYVKVDQGKYEASLIEVFKSPSISIR
jgi:hypothetical protein